MLTKTMRSDHTKPSVHLAAFCDALAKATGLARESAATQMTIVEDALRNVSCSLEELIDEALELRIDNLEKRLRKLEAALAKVTKSC